MVDSLSISEIEKKKICSKLTEYQYISEIYNLKLGRYLRWIRTGTNTITNGGIMVDIKFTDTGIHILCKNNRNQFIRYKFDDCITFQKISDEEFLVLSCV